MKLKKISVNQFPAAHFYLPWPEGLRWDMLIFDEDEEPKDAILAYCREIYDACPYPEGKRFSPQFEIYGSAECWKADQRPYNEVGAFYREKGFHPEDAEEKTNLEGALLKKWAAFDKDAEDHMRGFYKATYKPPGEADLAGCHILGAWTKNFRHFNSEGPYPYGSYRLRGDFPFEEHMGSRTILKLKGRFLAEYEEERDYPNIIQVFQVDEIESKPMYTEEEYAEFRRQAAEGPFLGRLNNPEVFGENPDLFGPMTPEQWDRLCNPEKYGYERVENSCHKSLKILPKVAII